MNKSKLVSAVFGIWLAAAPATAIAGNDLSFLVKDPGATTATATHVKKLPAPASEAAPLQLMGCVFGSSAGNKSGIYRISTTEPAMEMLNDKAQATGGGTAGKGRYYCQWYLQMLGMEIWTNMEFDTATWEWEGGIGHLESQAFDLAYDNATDRIYGCFFDPDENYKGQRLVFGWMDPATYINDYAMVNPICDLFECFSGMAFDGSGQLFALTKEGLLYRVDKESGDRQAVGQTGLTPQYNSSAAIDPKTGQMYYFLCTDAETALYTIDTTTAAATKIYVLPGGEEIQGLAIFEPQAAQGAPAPATDLSATFDGGNLAGSVTFTAPTKTYDGKEAQGEISYTVSYRPYDQTDVDYQTLASGTTSYGQTVDAPVTLPGNGQYSFGVVLTSTAGDDSPMALTDTYVGFDTPLSPQDVKLTADGNTVTLTWTPATMSLHNGYIDHEGLTFSIVRFPDETVVAESHTGTSFTETIPEPETHTRYHYTVAADNHGMKSFEQKSNFIALGSFEVPYLCDFASEDDFAEFTVITKAASPDNYYHWEYHTGLQAAHVGNGRVADDDILITPAIEFEGGKTYRVKITASNSNEASKARFMFKAGSTPTREGIDEYQLSDIKEFTSKRPQTIDIETLFTPASTGSYHVGIHSVAAAESYDDLFIHSIAIDPDRNDAISDTAAETVVISAIQGAACVKGAHQQPVTVYAPNGMTVFSTICDADTLVIPLRQGVYIVSAGTSAANIIVR